MREERYSVKCEGVEFTAAPGALLIEALEDNGIAVPKLCHCRELSPTGSCRLCLVKVRPLGSSAAFLIRPSCAQRLTEPLEVIVFDDELDDMRRLVLEMLLAKHNDDCISCSRDGSCELQDLAYRYGIVREKRLFESGNMTALPRDFSSPVLDYDGSKCVLCERCVRACSELQGKGFLTLAGRGEAVYISTGPSDWKDSECDGCGQCVQACPTGALTAKPYGNRKFRLKDVEKRVNTTCPYCGVGCQLEVAVSKGKPASVQARFKAPNFGKTCVKGRFGLDFVDRQERLKKPLLRCADGWQETSWENVLADTAARLGEIREKYGADSIMGISSARCSNEENYLFQKFMRAVIGTNNVDHCARLCHASTVAGLLESFGSGAMTNPIADLEHAGFILVTGSNTTETHPVIATYIRRAQQIHGAQLMVVEPRRIALARNADYFLRPECGSDIAWINGMINVIIEAGLENRAFINQYTEGYEELRQSVREYTPEYVEQLTGIKAAELRAAALAFARAENAAIVYAMGITQHTCGTDNVKALANLALLTGQIGKDNAGLFPLRGQNNVQGACDMGALPDMLPGYKPLDSNWRQELEEKWQCRLPSGKGICMTELPAYIDSGKIKALYIMGENPLLSEPDVEHVRQALAKLELIICQDIFLTETSELAHIQLPACSFAEKTGTFTNTERRVAMIKPFIESIGESRPDWQIINDLARQFGIEWDYRSSDDVLNEINKCVGIYGGITAQRLQRGDSLQWPCPDENHPGTPVLHRGGLSRGKGRFFAVKHQPPAEAPCREFPFVLTTGRNLYQYHTGTMSRKTRALPQFSDEPYAEIHPADARRLRLSDAETIRVRSRRGAIEVRCCINREIKPGTVFIPFHFCEGAANVLTNAALDRVAKIPEYKVCSCVIEKQQTAKE